MDNLQERIEEITIEQIDKLLKREIAAKSDLRSEDSLAIWALSRLKSTLVAFNNYCPDVTAFYNGYAQAQADGAQTPLADEDLQIGINMQKQLIRDMAARIESEKQIFDSSQQTNKALLKKLIAAEARIGELTYKYEMACGEKFDLEAENAKLREALKEVQRYALDGFGSALRNHIYGTAERALKPLPESPKE